MGSRHRWNDRDVINRPAIDGNVSVTGLLIGHFGIIISGGLYVVGSIEWCQFVRKQSYSFNKHSQNINELKFYGIDCLI